MKRAQFIRNPQRTEHLEFYVRPPKEGLSGDHLGCVGACCQRSAECGILVRAIGGRARSRATPPMEILSNVVDQGLLGGGYRWSEREHFRCWLRPGHLGLAVGKLDTGFDQSDEGR